MIKADTFFSDSQKEKINAAIGEVETKTAGEVVVMVVDQSDTYPEANLLAGVIIGGLLALIVTDLLFSASLWYFAPLYAVVAFGIVWGTRFWPGLFRYFTLGARLENQVREEAVKAFYEKGLYKTRDKTGVLFFISLFERRVWILADEGIYTKISQERLQEYAGDIARGIKDGNAAEVLIGEINKVGKILAEHFPIRADDANELSNKVIIG
jgi:putative membrane protein